MVDVKRPVIEMEEELRDMEISMKFAEGEELQSMMDSYSRLSHQFELINGYAWKSEIIGVSKRPWLFGGGLFQTDFHLIRRPEDPCLP